MKISLTGAATGTLLRSVPLIFLALLLAAFGAASPRFLAPDNLSAILAQSSWLVVVALGMNFALLTAGVDLSVGAAMYVAAVVVGLAFPDSSVILCAAIAALVGGSLGAANGMLIVGLQLPAFVVTLATTFVARGVGLYLSSTKIVFAGAAVAELGRAKFLGLPVPVLLGAVAVLIGWVLLHTTPFGAYARSIGADSDAARRAGVPVRGTQFAVYALCGAFAGFAGFISLSQTSAASGAFAQNAEFLAIAAAVLGGTSLFGGRGSLWAPVIGAIVVTTVHNGLGLINANPYVYPVITGAVIFFAALFDSVRSRLQPLWDRHAAHASHDAMASGKRPGRQLA